MKRFFCLLMGCLQMAAAPTFGYLTDEFHDRYLPLLDQSMVYEPNYVLRHDHAANEFCAETKNGKENLLVIPALPFHSASEFGQQPIPPLTFSSPASDSANSKGSEAIIRAMSNLRVSSRTGQDLYFYLLGLVQLEYGDISEARLSFNNALMQSAQPGSETVRLKILLSLYELEMLAENHLLALEYITEYQKTFKRVNAKDTVISMNSVLDSILPPPTNRAQNTPIAQHWTFYATLVLLVLLLFTWLIVLPEREMPLFWLKTKIWAMGGPGFQLPFLSLDKKRGHKGARTSSEETIDDVHKVDEEKIEKLIKLRGMRLLTEDEWDDFKVIFDSIYPDLFIRLLEGRKSLTLTDEKVVCLLRLHCNTQEIAIRLGISQNSANTARSRLRKRLGLAHHEYIEEFLLRHSTPNAFDERYKKRRN